jgi:hypothetical protein
LALNIYTRSCVCPAGCTAPNQESSCFADCCCCTLPGFSQAEHRSTALHDHSLAAPSQFLLLHCIFLLPGA